MSKVSYLSQVWMVKIQFVYICRDGDNEELRYSIRSVLEFFPDAEIWVVGGKPSWYVGNHISVKQTNLKYSSAQQNIKALIESEDIDNSFVYMNDDFYLTDTPDFTKKYHRGLLKNRIEEDAHMQKYLYYKFLCRTYYKLQKRISDPYDYELHIPILLEKRYLKKVFHQTLWRSFYGNLFVPGDIQIKDCKVYSDLSKIELDSFIAESIPFLSSSDRNFESMKNNFLESRFPNSSSCELI